MRKKYRKYTEEYFRKNFDKYSSKDLWYFLKVNKSKIDESFLREFKDVFHVSFIFANYNRVQMSENFYREFMKETEGFLDYTGMSEEFIEEIKDRIEWNDIFVDRTMKHLSEKFFQKHKDKTVIFIL